MDKTGKTWLSDVVHRRNNHIGHKSDLLLFILYSYFYPIFSQLGGHRSVEIISLEKMKRRRKRRGGREGGGGK